MLVWRFLNFRHLIDSLAVQYDVRQAQRKQQEQLIHLQRMECIGMVAGGMTHNIKNILAAVTGHANLILDQTEEGGPIHKSARLIESASEQV